MLDTITFDQLPKAVAEILDGIAEIKSICNAIRDKDSERMNISPWKNCAPTIPRILPIKPSAAGNVSVTYLIIKTR